MGTERRQELGNELPSGRVTHIPDAFSLVLCAGEMTKGISCELCGRRAGLTVPSPSAGS